MPYKRRQKSEDTGPKIAEVLHSNKANWVKVITPYIPAFVDELKSSIQYDHRSWDPDGKFWLVNQLHIETLTELLNEHYDEVKVNLVSSDKTNLFTQLFDIIPSDYHDKVYRSLLLALHPDNGGNNELISRLDKAYQKDVSIL